MVNEENEEYVYFAEDTISPSFESERKEKSDGAKASNWVDFISYFELLLSFEKANFFSAERLV